MTPEERQLIAGLFERMRDFGAPEKEREAEALINQSVRAMPDAPYMLVQSVLVQEQALEAASARVQELEERVQALEQVGERSQAGGGSFLGGLFGGAKPAAPEPRPATRSASVPVIGTRAGGQPSAWASGPASVGSQPQAQQAQPASGGFMRSAMATAAGVAGGMLLADGIRNMMGGNSAHASTAKKAEETDTDKKAEADTDNKAGEANTDSPKHEEGAQDAGYDGGDWQDDWGGGDLEI